jgi:hypothetical protein
VDAWATASFIDVTRNAKPVPSNGVIFHEMLLQNLELIIVHFGLSCVNRSIASSTNLSVSALAGISLPSGAA